MAVRLSFHGAARAVTGSCYLLEAENARVLIDCGLFQGSKTERGLNVREFPFDPSSLTAMLLTHAHIDHSGLIPKLVKHGFKAKIHCTAPTVDLCEVMLADSAFIQEADVRNLNERNRKRGLPEVEPIYSIEDAATALKHFTAVAYGAWMEPAPGIRARWWNAGHLLGSASIEIEVARDAGLPLRILFSGDVGPGNKMLQPDPDAPRTLDFVISESTYGGRDRFERSEEGRRQILASAVNDASARDGALLIPSFAVERTQEIVTDLVLLMERGTIPKAQIFIDSPLASKATEIFVRYSQTMQHGDDLGRAFSSDFVKATESVDESKSLSRLKGFRIIVAASGMCDAGRIRHHLKNHLWEASTTVLLAGFQAEGSLGRILQEGARMVTIMGEQIEVKAAIRQIEDYSGHADGPELVEWVKRRQPIARTVFITHGEEESQIALASNLEEIGIAPSCIVRPRLDDVYDLSGETCVLVSNAITPRIDPAAMGKRDANNELQGLLADIQHRLDRSDEASKATILQRLRRALDGDESHDSQNVRRSKNKPPSQGQGFDEG